MLKRPKARHKLNASYFNGSLTLAAIMGWMAQSCLLFVSALIVLLIGNVIAGEIRMKKRNDKRPAKQPK